MSIFDELDEEYVGPEGNQDAIDKPSKDEIAVAKWMKKHVPTKKTKFVHHNVDFFTSSKALDALMASKFGQGDGCLFPTREIAIEFLDVMLVHKFFHRAKKIPVNEAELKQRAKKPITGTDNGKDKETNKEKENKAKEKEIAAEKEAKEATNKENKEKKKRKIRLDMHPEQLFVDGNEAYVWIYDPIPMHYWLFGALLVIGAIVICMFPLWPQALRKGVYYLSIAGAGFLVFILSLVVIRFIVFCLVWLATGGHLHFWLFPNLTEDVGFFESFWPIYTHEYHDKGCLPGAAKDKRKKRKKDKDSDAEDEQPSKEPLLKPSGVDAINSDSTSIVNNTDNNTESDSNQANNHNTPSGSDSESSQRSSIDRDFEMVDAADVDTS